MFFVNTQYLVNDNKIAQYYFWEDFMYSNMVENIIRYVNVSTNKSKRINPDILQYYDLTFVLKGSLTYIINGDEYILEKNDLIFLSPGMKRERLVGISPVKYVSFNFLLKENCNVVIPFFMRNIISDNILNVLNVFPKLNTTFFPFSMEKSINLLNYILLEIISYNSEHNVNKHIVEATSYIEEHIRENLNLTKVANHIYLSKTYLSSIFKTELNITVNSYIRKLKMNYAKNLIRDGEISLKEIAQYLGFDDYNYFSRIFKKEFNISPLKFSKSSNKQN